LVWAVEINVNTMLQHGLLIPSVFELLLFFISIVAGIFGAILGLGGGILIVPTLTLLFGINIRYAVGAGIISVIATSSGASAAYVRDRVANVRVAMFLEVATTLGALSGALLSSHVPTRILFFIFSMILFYSAWMMSRKKESHEIRQTQDSWSTRLKLNSIYYDPAIKKNVPYAVENIPQGFFMMLGAGLLSALLGVGSGSLKVTAMDMTMKLPIKVSSATSNLMMGVTAAASAGVYFMRGEIQPLLVVPVALGVLVGALIGSRLMMKINSASLRKFFMAVLLVIALQMSLRAFGIGSH
jgi:uncharacterized membrane protein YfcA